MGEDGWCARYGDAGQVGGSGRGSGTAGGVVSGIVVMMAVAGVEVVLGFDVVVDGKPGGEWSKRDVI